MIKNAPLFPKVFLIISLGFLISACSLTPAAEETLRHTKAQFREYGGFLIWEPAQGTPRETGLIFYPGGLVDPRGYDTLLSALAARGYRVVICPMPFNLAIMNINKGLKVAEKFPEQKQWVWAGHSLGGSSAALALTDHPDAAVGLILLASYPPDKADLSEWDKPVLSLWASEDGLAEPAEIETTRALLPPAVAVETPETLVTRVFPPGSQESSESMQRGKGFSIFHEIQGGNHAQFGNYGPQKKDGQPLISGNRQREITLAWMEAFLRSRSWQSL